MGYSGSDVYGILSFVGSALFTLIKFYASKLQTRSVKYFQYQDYFKSQKVKSIHKIKLISCPNVYEFIY